MQFAVGVVFVAAVLMHSLQQLSCQSLQVWQLVVGAVQLRGWQ